MSNKTQVYCNIDNNYETYLLKGLWKDLSISTKQLKEKRLEIKNFKSNSKNFSAIQLVKIGKIMMEIKYFEDNIKSINKTINHISRNLLIC